MLRRDYILRMIEEFVRVLSRIESYKREQRWDSARGEIESEFGKLLGVGSKEAASLTETEILARMVKGEPTQAIRDKSLMLASLFKEAGDVVTGEGRLEEARAHYLQGLHLLLSVLSREDDVAFPEFMPRIEVFVIALQGEPLSRRTQAMLMQHYERIADFAKAEDLLHELIEADPGDPAALDFGIAFYERLVGHPDSLLEEGNLPRAEVEAGLAELRGRMQR